MANVSRPINLYSSVDYAVQGLNDQKKPSGAPTAPTKKPKKSPKAPPKKKAPARKPKAKKAPPKDQKQVLPWM